MAIRFAWRLATAVQLGIVLPSGLNGLNWGWLGLGLGLAAIYLVSICIKSSYVFKVRAPITINALRIRTDRRSQMGLSQCGPKIFGNITGVPSRFFLQNLFVCLATFPPRFLFANSEEEREGKNERERERLL